MLKSFLRSKNVISNSRIHIDHADGFQDPKSRFIFLQGWIAAEKQITSISIKKQNSQLEMNLSLKDRPDVRSAVPNLKSCGFASFLPAAEFRGQSLSLQLKFADNSQDILKVDASTIPKTQGPEPKEPHQIIRTRIANKYLSGKGVEIGALLDPLIVDRSQIAVSYVDRMPAVELRNHYPEYLQVPIVDPDIVDDGEKLTKVADDSQDFLIANHMVEHCEDPISTLQLFFRKLKIGGKIFLAMPDRNQTFDKDRQLTTWDHLIADSLDRGSSSRESHFDDWVANVSKLEGPAAVTEKARLKDIGYSIHYHVWTPESFMSFILQLQNHLQEKFKVLHFETTQGINEFVVVLEKTKN